MALHDLTDPEAVRAAIREFDQLGQEAFLTKYGFGPARDVVLKDDGREYDSKAIVGAAHRYQHPDVGPLAPQKFNGGDPTVSKLQDLGFETARGGGSADRRIWVVRGGREGEREDESLEENLIAIGWGALPDQSDLTSPEEAADLLRAHEHDKDQAQISARRSSIFLFRRRSRPGTSRYCRRRHTRMVARALALARGGHIAVGRVTGDYAFRPDVPGDTRHIRSVEWLDKAIPRDCFGDLPKWVDRPPTVGLIPVPNTEALILSMLETREPIRLAREAGLEEVLEDILSRIASADGSLEELRQLVTDVAPERVSALVGKMNPAVLERADALASELPEPQREAAREGIVRLWEALVAHRNQVVHASPDQLTEAMDVATRIIAALVAELPIGRARQRDGRALQGTSVEEILTGFDRVDPERVPEVWGYLERLREHLVEETPIDDLEERNRRRLQAVYQSIMDDSYTVRNPVTPGTSVVSDCSSCVDRTACLRSRFHTAKASSIRAGSSTTERSRGHSCRN